VKDLFSVEGKVVLVTGGAAGIGAMIARGLVEAGARVYVTSRSRERGEAFAAGLAAGDACRALRADLASDAGVERLADELAGREPALHVLVNNAAAHFVAPFHEHTGPAWEQMFAVNVRAAFELTRRLADRLEAAATPADPARVINIGSADGLRIPALEAYAYGASKAALHHLTRHLARRLSRRHITVNAIAPGPFDTEMLEPVLSELGERVAAAVPLKRLGTPEDAVGAALFLASRAGAYVTGSILSVDGGMATCG
jgi:NAD(P)-dependent dehydrogenase (short-subunit alcohol dehydrogenase family)